jgi:predicted permease
MSWRRFFRREKADSDLIQEIDLFLAEEIDENMARGLSPEEASRQARLKFGNPRQVRESLWQQNTVAFVDSVWHDLKYSFRTLARSPGFTLMAVFVIALGIGANVALFTVVRSVLLNPLPYRDPGQLYTIYEHNQDTKDFNSYLPVAAGSFAEWQKAAQHVAQMAMVSPWHEYNVSAGGGKLPEQVYAAWCSWNFFSTLGVTPTLGRAFTASDDQPGAEATVILSAPFWNRRYSSDPSVLGKKIWLDGKPYTVIGIMPSSFVYSGAYGGSTTQVWTTVGHEASPWLMETFEDHEFLVIARLLPGTTLASLVDHLRSVQRQIKADHASPSIRPSVVGRPMLDDAVHDYKTPLYILLAATGCVLLIACLNVASLLIARTAARGKEMAIRAALGGGRWRLLRERLMESLLLSLAGGGAGLLLAWAALIWLVRTRHDMNRVEAIHIDFVVAAFTVAAIVVCALFSGLISALSADGKQVLAALQESSRTHSASHARASLRRGLLVLEVGLTVMLLVGAGLLLKSYQRFKSVDLGIPADNVLTMKVSLPDGRYEEDTQRVAFFESLIERVRALPGVQAAGLVSAAPGQGWNGNDFFLSVVEHPPVAKGQEMDFMKRGADPGYFAAIQIPLLRGRLFTADERLKRAGVAVISQSGARIAFGAEDPIGKHVMQRGETSSYEIVGVVGDTRWNVSQPMHPTIYCPIYGNGYNFATIVVRSTHDVEALALPVQKIVGELDPDLPVSYVMTLRETIGHAAIGSQFNSVLVLSFAVIALLLAAAGLYGVLAYLVTQRTGEIGIRIALGAQREQVLQLMLLDGLQPALLGLLLGLAGSAAAVHLLRSMLYETEPFDPGVFAIVTATLLVVAALACLVPSWRASRLDPMQALRTE